ncbi:ABC transporter ATP-binding protein [Pseudonocardia zijingensis]|uniref:ABC transporter ATP-binding protein n=1 Tax=Pseudonocardia zijingensis TaxID=153376 RepID=UPI0031D79FBC
MDAGTGLVDTTVTYGDVPALRGVTLLAGPGEVLAVVGPSGSGKTTALRAVAGLHPLRRGRVLVAGEDVTTVPVSRRDISMVFRSTALAPFLDVAANLTRSAAAFGVPEPEAAQRVATRSRLLGLVRLLPRMPRTLSAGESGLTGIGRTLVRTPRAFLFDEPLAHLDPVERARARRAIVDTVRRTGVGALYVTHDQAEAMAVGDRLAVLHEGRIRQVDHPRRVYDAPVDTFVADFVGDAGIGLLPAQLVAAGGAAGFRVGERTIPLWGPVPHQLADRVGTRVLLGLRAEDVAEAGPDADPASVPVPVAVRSVEHPGPDAVVRAEVGLPGEADGARLVARIPGGTTLRTGARAQLLLDARRAHVFDPDTGRALLHPN